MFKNSCGTLVENDCCRKSSTYKGREQENQKGTEKNYKNNQKTVNKMAVTTYLSIITLNVNG